jgi:hypothetical protein
MTTMGHPVYGVVRHRMALGVCMPPLKRTRMGLELTASGTVRGRMDRGVRRVRRACMYMKTRGHKWPTR